VSQEDVVEGLELLYNWQPTTQPKLPIPQEPKEVSFDEQKEKNFSQYSSYYS
jgi:hypothetical protein